MLTLVPTPIGNIADISLRAIDALMDAEILLCEDTRVTKKLLHILETRYGRSPKHTPSFVSVHSHSEPRFLQHLPDGYFDANVVYVSDAGMPGISDPGAKLVRYCIDHGIAYDVLPGANAVLTAYAASGFDTSRMLFFGFLPHKGAARTEALHAALYSGYVTVLYEAPHRLEKLLREIAKHAPDRQLFAAKELTKLHQEYRHGTAGELLETLGNAPIRGEWVVVINAGAQHTTRLGEADILELDLPKKAAAKLLAKITGESVKTCYQKLVDSKE